MDNTERSTDYKQKYKTLKRKLKGLVYEHELLSEQLERAQKKMLRVSKDRSFLLDRMLQYEKVVDSSSDSDATDASDSDGEKPTTKKKTNNSASQGTPTSSQPSVLSANSEDTPDGNKKATKAKASKKQKSVLKKSAPMSAAAEDQEKFSPVIGKAQSVSVKPEPSDGDRLSDMEADGADTGLVIDMK